MVIATRNVRFYKTWIGETEEAKGFQCHQFKKKQKLKVSGQQKDVLKPQT